MKSVGASERTRINGESIASGSRGGLPREWVKKIIAKL